MGAGLRVSLSRCQIFFALLLVNVSFLTSLASAARTKAIIPLYVDIERDAKSWDPLYKVYATTVLLLGSSWLTNPAYRAIQMLILRS
jgi:hypothetical protein